MYLPTYLRYILTSTGTKLVQSTDRGPNYVAPVVFTYLIMGTYYLLLRIWNDINTRYKKKKRKNEKKTRTKRNEVLDGVRSDFLSINSSWFFEL